MPDPNTCGNEYAALTGSPYAPRFKEQAYVAEINQLLARVAELEGQVRGIPDLLLIAHMQGAEQAKDQIQALRAQISALDCRLVGRVADLSGSHCPADNPCDRCVAERRIEELSHAYAVQGLALEDLTAERDRFREALEIIISPSENASDPDEIAKEALRLKNPAFECLRCFPGEDCPEDCLDRNHRVTDN